jgi:pimeloyl-ACP methyl ester carboxylesterase
MTYSSITKKSQINLVFLHGWGGCWQSWYPILERLKKNFNLYAPDLPGFGKEPLSTPYNLENYVDFVVDFIIKNKMEKPILIGH